jgi:hypothetical protein
VERNLWSLYPPDGSGSSNLDMDNDIGSGSGGSAGGSAGGELQYMQPTVTQASQRSASPQTGGSQQQQQLQRSASQQTGGSQQQQLQRSASQQTGGSQQQQLQRSASQQQTGGSQQQHLLSIRAPRSSADLSAVFRQPGVAGHNPLTELTRILQRGVHGSNCCFLSSRIAAAACCACWVWDVCGACV